MLRSGLDFPDVAGVEVADVGLEVATVDLARLQCSPGSSKLRREGVVREAAELGKSEVGEDGRVNAVELGVSEHGVALMLVQVSDLDEPMGDISFSRGGGPAL